MRGFFGTKTQELTLGQSLVATLIISVVSWTPLIACMVADKIQERRNRSEYDE